MGKGQGLEAETASNSRIIVEHSLPHHTRMHVTTVATVQHVTAGVNLHFCVRH